MRYDSTLPRDLMVNTPCFRWSNFTIQDAESLANDVLDAYDDVPWFNSLPETTAKIYDLEGSPPVLPMATVTRRPGLVKSNATAREIALCLSFSGGQHQKRQRGRIYIPNGPIGGINGLRPSGSQIGWVSQLGSNLYDVGATNVDWIVWSRVNGSATAVTRHWCDDEWDVQRRRGLRPTTRTQVDH